MIIYFTFSLFVFLILQTDDSYCGQLKRAITDDSYCGQLKRAITGINLVCAIFWPLFVIALVIFIIVDMFSDVPYND